MTVIAIRIYDAPQNAKSAVTKLKKSNVNDSQIAVVSGEGKTAADVAAAITAAGIPAANASALAASVAKGGTMVAVCPLFGRAAEAAEILDSCSPTEACELATGAQPDAKNDAGAGQALSAAAGWDLLSSDPTPLSSKMNWKLLSDNKFPASKLFGWGMLSNNKFPASSAFSWKLLSDKKFPASSAFNWKLLSDTKFPLSSKYGWSLLSNNATPLSDKLGWPVLSKK
ncbi:hypothetical protein [Rhodopila globiformis]|uniref:Uncharacterized protein n=1 Tax=Rhodopila globiformis TaxID=1071 RepID=A0A2S6MYY4_RHOGL|nr:hypothetical protein [Rhodopila globiformis]PPQ27568.1 hypothetical protein CCS01_27005 [Rhodopila globiformis]